MSICTPQLLGSVCFRVWIDVMRDAQDGEVAYSKQSVYSSAPAVDGSVPMRIHCEIFELGVVLHLLFLNSWHASTLSLVSKRCECM